MLCDEDVRDDLQPLRGELRVKRVRQGKVHWRFGELCGFECLLTSFFVQILLFVNLNLKQRNGPLRAPLMGCVLIDQRMLPALTLFDERSVAPVDQSPHPVWPALLANVLPPKELDLKLDGSRLDCRRPRF